MNAFADRVKDLQAKFDEPLPESWKAEKDGEEIVGTFVRLDKGTTEFGPSWIVVLDTGGGVLRSVWLYHQSLQNEMRRAAPEPGELVGVRYEGKKPVKNPQPGRKNTYHAYRVVVDRERDETKPDWTVLGSDPVDQVFAPTVEDEIMAGGGDADDIPFAPTFA